MVKVRKPRFPIHTFLILSIYIINYFLIFNLKSSSFDTFLRHLKNIKIIDYFNNKNEILKYILSMCHISVKI